MKEGKTQKKNKKTKLKRVEQEYIDWHTLSFNPLGGAVLEGVGSCSGF
jgi:hypothetical protein